MSSLRNSIEINKPINIVWNAIRNFHDLSWAPEVITSLEKVGDVDGNKIGAKRILNDAFHERLTALDNDRFTFSYSIDDGPGPVSKSAVKNYVGTVQLTEKGTGTLVVWSSVYESDNDDVPQFCNPIYIAFLTAMKTSLECD